MPERDELAEMLDEMLAETGGPLNDVERAEIDEEAGWSEPERSDRDDETTYLLASPANARRLQESLEHDRPLLDEPAAPASEWSVTVEWDATIDVSDDLLLAVAAIGGAAGGQPGGRRVETTMTVRAADAPDAAKQAMGRVLAIIPGKVAAVEVATTEDADRRLTEPNPLAHDFFESVVREVAMLTANQVAQALGCDTDRLREKGLIILHYGANTFVPAFQVGTVENMLRPQVSAVNSRLLADRDPWGAMAWWMSANPRWDHRRPIEHPDDEQLVALVEADHDDGF